MICLARRNLAFHTIIVTVYQLMICHSTDYIYEFVQSIRVVLLGFVMLHHVNAALFMLCMVYVYFYIGIKCVINCV